MATSDAWGKEWISSCFDKLSDDAVVTSVVDIGCGDGTYSRLMRRNAQFWTGIEVWGPYVEEFKLRELYDQVIVSDARFIDPGMFAADVVILGDVLEHMNEYEGMCLLSDILKANSTFNGLTVIICVPMLHLEQDAVNDNPFEMHRMCNHYSEERMDRAVAWVTKAHGGVTVDKLVGDVVGYWVVRRGTHTEVQLPNAAPVA